MPTMGQFPATAVIAISVRSYPRFSGGIEGLYDSSLSWLLAATRGIDRKRALRRAEPSVLELARATASRARYPHIGIGGHPLTPHP
jgi:hypothetical protein